jgi:ubiquinone/menaquinone biosynthesis C-methylase UbiE
MFKEEIINKMVEDARSVWPKNWPEIEEMFNRCCLAISVDIIMKQLGLFENKNDFETLDTIKKKVKIFNDAEYVFQKMIDILCEERIITKKDSGYLCLDPNVDIESPSEALVIATRKLPEEGAPFQWLSRGAGGLLQFIKGKLFGEEVMFPWNDFKLVEEVYFTSNVYGFWSKLAGKTVKRIIEDKFNSKITVLEVGAGTGNGTHNVFENVQDVEKKFHKYIFTDISKALIQRASKRFKQYNFIEYKTLDITGNLTEQGFEKECADIVLAVNVLHATDDLLSACKAVYELVKPDGYVVLGEIAPPPNGLYRYMELTFGLLASYNSYKDKELRPNCPIIRPDKWIEIFKKAGFKDAIAIPGDKLENCDRGGVVIAQK